MIKGPVKYFIGVPEQDPSDVFKEFYKKEKDNYPDLSSEAIKDICFSSWRNVRDTIRSDDLVPVRILYFGLFIPKKGRVINLYKNLENNFKSGAINEKIYLRLKRAFSNYIKRHNLKV